MVSPTRACARSTRAARSNAWKLTDPNDEHVNPVCWSPWPSSRTQYERERDAYFSSVLSGAECDQNWLLGSGAPEIEGVDPKLVAKYWPKASFTFELRAHGEIVMSASVKGRTMWDGSLHLDELLKARSQGTPQVDLEGVDIDVDALLTLIDSKFQRKKEKRKHK